MDEYTEHDFTFDLLAGIYAEHDKLRETEGDDVATDYMMDNVMTVGSCIIELETAGFTSAQIQAEIHMRQYTEQGFTSISFE